MRTAEHQRRQLEQVKPMFKENEQLLALVKALEESLVELKEEQAGCKCTWSG